MTKQDFESFDIISGGDDNKKYYFNKQNKKSMKKIQIYLYICKFISLIICVSCLVLTYYYRVDILKSLNLKEECLCNNTLYENTFSNAQPPSFDSIYKILGYENGEPDESNNSDLNIDYIDENLKEKEKEKLKYTEEDVRFKLLDIEKNLNFTLDTLKTYVLENRVLENRTNTLQDIISSNAEIIEYLTNKTKDLGYLEKKIDECNNNLNKTEQELKIYKSDNQNYTKNLEDTNNILNLLNEQCLNETQSLKNTNAILNKLNADLLSSNITNTNNI